MDHTAQYTSIDYRTDICNKFILLYYTGIRMDRSVHKRAEKRLLNAPIAPTTTATQPPSTPATTETLLSDLDDSTENAIDEAASLLVSLCLMINLLMAYEYIFHSRSTALHRTRVATKAIISLSFFKWFPV